MSRWSLAALFIVCSSPAAAQVQRCDDCVLGIYDDKERTRTEGVAIGATKDIFVGVDLAPGMPGVAGVHFSISGLVDFVIDLDFLVEPFVAIGSLRYENNSSLNLTWESCQAAHLTLMRIRLTNLGREWPVNHTLRIRVPLPPGNPALYEAYFTLCNPPDFQPLFPTAGTYVLNPTTAMQPATWSEMKALFD